MINNRAFRSYIVRVISYALPFAVIMLFLDWALGTFYAEEVSPGRTAIALAIQSLLFGLIMAALPIRSFRGIKRPEEASEREDVRMESPAYHNGVEGWLVLTGDRLAFISSGSREGAITVPMGAVADAGVKKWLGVMPTGIRLSLGRNSEETFLVEKPERWMKVLRTARPAN